MPLSWASNRRAARPPLYNPHVTEYYCYILKCSDGTLYTGWTTNPERRVREHQNGRAARYTSQRLPVKLVYLERQDSRSEAQRREYRIKRNGRHYKMRLIKSYRDQPYPDRSSSDNDQRSP